MNRSYCPPRVKFGWWMVAFGIFLSGAVAGFLLLADRWRARTWVETRATFLAAEVAPRWAGPARVVIHYRYEFGGVPFTARYPVLAWPDGSRAASEKGAEANLREVTTCYVHPGSPGRATLARGVTTGSWLTPLLLLAASGVMGWGARRALAQQRVADAATLYTLETGVLEADDIRRAA